MKKLKLMLKQNHKVKIKSFLKKESLSRNILAYLFSYNLTKLAIIYGSDKWGGHSYTQHYQTHFNKFRFKNIKVLEIGVGGYSNPNEGGNSLRMWKMFFPFAKIYAIDIYDKSQLEEKRIKIFKGSQIDYAFLDSVCKQAGEFNLIIDDGSHINIHVIKTFNYLFTKLKKGGIYVIEDTQTSYWENYGGTSKDFNTKGTIYHYFKSLIDGLNHKEFMIDNYKINYFEKHIISMHFYHNMIFIYKGDNNEFSNIFNKNRTKDEKA